MAAEIGGHQVIGNHVGHHMQPGVRRQEYSVQRNGPSEVERQRSERITAVDLGKDLPEVDLTKQWVHRVDVVELDGSDLKR